jgi:hypothetical protein
MSTARSRRAQTSLWFLEGTGRLADIKRQWRIRMMRRGRHSRVLIVCRLLTSRAAANQVGIGSPAS